MANRYHFAIRSRTIRRNILGTYTQNSARTKSRARMPSPWSSHNFPILNWRILSPKESSWWRVHLPARGSAGHGCCHNSAWCQTAA